MTRAAAAVDGASGGVVDGVARPDGRQARPPLRVLHVYSGNLYGGVETLLVSLAARQAQVPRVSHEFALCFEGRLSRRLEDLGARVHRLGAVRLSRPWSLLRARMALRALLRRGQADVVVCHSPWSQAAFGPVARRGGYPLVFFLHEAVQGRHWLERWASRTRPDRALCNSRFTARMLPNMYPGLGADVVYLPVAAHGSRTDAAERRALRERLGASDADVVVVQVSRFERLKGHALLVDALARLRESPGWRCWIVGGVQRPSERDYLGELRAQVARDGIADRVTFLGERTDVPRILAAADVYCQPNTGPETFGIAFVEAMHAGLPVVTTAMGGALEIVDERCGLLVPPEADALAGALRRLLREPDARARLGAAGPSRAQQLCDPDARLGDLARALEAAARRSAPAGSDA